VPIKAHSGGIGQLPLPEIKLSSNIANGDILVYDADAKIFRNSVAADSTGRLFVTGAKNAGGVGLVKGTAGRDLEILGLKAGNLIDITPSIDGKSLVINVNASFQSKIGGQDGFTGELKTSQNVIVDAGVTEYKFYKENNGQEMEINPNYTKVYRNGRRLNPVEYLITESNSIVFYDAQEDDILHIDTINNETDTRLIHSKPVIVAAGDNSYEFLDQSNNLININRNFLEVYVNRIKVHQGEYVVQENQIIFAEGAVVEQDQIEIITLGDI
jgi:hypothetical protein